VLLLNSLFLWQLNNLKLEQPTFWLAESYLQADDNDDDDTDLIDNPTDIEVISKL
jgi:hypothetical protein